jgi:hypothetical protein
MNLKSFVVSLISLMFLTSLTTFSQNNRLSGIVMDKSAKMPIIGAIIILKEKADTTRQYSALTDNNGRFVISSLPSTSFKLIIQNLSYKKISLPVVISKKDLNLGIIDLEPESKELNEVVVIGQGPAAVQKGDTTEMSSSAYKTNPDANAEDLVKKMPGITVENGTVKAQGEDVKKILVDGKQFFGDDPSVALKNLPADVIDKIQVFNKLSEQAELTGVDDGNSQRTINIVTKQSRRSGQFGKIIGGTDFTDKYLLTGNVNIFKGNRRITILGNLNNINQQNFSAQDLIGASSMRGGGGGFGGAQNGITKTKSLGLNYTNNFGKKVTMNASYFYNSTDNNLVQESNTENLFITDGKYSKNNSNSRTQNYNHRFNMRLEYNIDSMNTIMFIPRFSTQNNLADRSSLYNISGGIVNSSTQSFTNTDASSYNLSSLLIYRHKFNKPRRTLTLNLNGNMSDRNTENTQLALVDTVADDQYSGNLVNGSGISANISYTEPITKYSMLMVSASTSLSKNETDKETYRLGDAQQKLERLDSLSNVYNNHYNTNRGGLSYIIVKGAMNLTLGMDYQQANLSGNQTFPKAGKINKTFENFLPNAMIMYKMSKTSNLRVFYRSSTNEPSISQLQKVTDNSNRLSLRTGNPDLKQEHSQTLNSQLSYANPNKGFNTFLVLSGGYTSDNIGNRTIYAQRDTLYLPEYDLKLQPGAQLSVPVNLDHSYNVRSLISVGQYIKPIKSNVSLLGGVGYSQNPGYIDTILNRSNSYNYTNSLIIASNISEKLDFTLSYTSIYSIVKNSKESKNIRNNEYWYQSANFKVNWIFWKNFVLQTDVSGQFNQGLSTNYNQNYVVWNASFGKKFLKNNAAELKLSCFDLLNQNNNISRSVTASIIQDSRTNTFPRYFLLIFTYNLRNFNGQSMPAEGERVRFREGGGGFERGNRNSNVMPMGAPPQGVPSGPPPSGF